MRRWIALGLTFLGATPIAAQDSPRFCPNRPSLGESGCVTEPGHVQVEGSLIDWTRDDTSDQRQDTILAADLQARFGLTATNELQIGWTAYGHVRTRDKTTGGIDTRSAVGDVRIGLRQNLQNPDGKGLSFAAEPFVTLPVGRDPVGASTWGAGAVIPVTYDLSEALNLAFTGEVDAAPDQDRARRHLAYSGIVGLGYKLSKALTAVGELEVQQDNDPGNRTTQTTVAASLAWQPRDALQLDLLVAGGLNRDTPDVRIVAGGAVVF